MKIKITTEELWENVKELGFRSIDCDESFAKKNANELFKIIFLIEQTANLFYIAPKMGIQNISIVSAINKGYVNTTFNRDKIFLYAYHQWFMIYERDHKRLFLCKME